jgi:hypothetical protein
MHLKLRYVERRVDRSGAVLKYLFKLARYHGVVTADKAAGPEDKPTARPDLDR